MKIALNESEPRTHEKSETAVLEVPREFSNNSHCLPPRYSQLASPRGGPRKLMLISTPGDSDHTFRS